MDPDQQKDASQLLPSEICDKDYVRMPFDPEDFEEVTYKSGGKWMLHNLQTNEQDKAWKALLPLYDKGIILGLKSSTAVQNQAQTIDKKKGSVIMCYTADSNNKKDVKKVADDIRLAVRLKEAMYYKSNAASIKGLYPHEGHYNVSNYMHTDKYELYERDKNNRWKIVEF